MGHREMKTIFILVFGFVSVVALLVALFSSHNGRYVTYRQSDNPQPSILDTRTGIIYSYRMDTDEVVKADLQTGRFEVQKVKRPNNK
jgi:hypothetical protein